MTKKDLNDFNDLAYKFLGYTNKRTNNLTYHSDWNSIMQIVELIETTTFVLPEQYKRGFLKNTTHENVIFNVCYDNREEYKGWYSDVSFNFYPPFIYTSTAGEEHTRFETKKEATINAIYGFLKWYYNIYQTQN